LMIDNPRFPNVVNAARICIVLGSDCTVPESKAAQILEARILKRSRIETRSVSENEAYGGMNWSDVTFVLGSPCTNELTKDMMEELEAELPTLPDTDKQHPEGFVVKSGIFEENNVVLITGVDDRGTIYGVGWVLRAITFRSDHIEVPDIDIQQEPAFPIRGAYIRGAGAYTKKFGDVRPQTEGELREMMEDHLLIGVNTLQDDPEVARPYGMMTATTGSRRTANDIPRLPDGERLVREEWAADGGVNRRLICPSVPEARQAALDTIDEIFREEPDHDFFFLKSGDPGGCHCPECRPWGRTCAELARDIAGIVHRHHPDCKVILTNQDMTDEDNRAFYDYLNEHDTDWLYAVSYGPGSDEMQTYYRGPVNPRWFEYEGFGPMGNYLKHIHHVLPRDVCIVLFTDLTHWIQAQVGVENPDPALTTVFARRTWNMRPRAFHETGREILHYAIGDLPYNEGMHGDFNKWLWYRMLWDPNRSAEEITKEYCRYWFGPDAVEEMAEAIFLMEKTLEKPLLGNEGVSRAVELVRSAGDRIPENLMDHDYRYRIIAQKALMDRYAQLKLERGQELKDLARPLLEAACGSEDPGTEIKRAIDILERPKRTSTMMEIKEEALSLGEESNRIIGYRVPACLTVDNWDLTEIGWWVKILKEGLSSGEREEMLESVNMVLDYEDPGEGGFYEKLGVFDRPDSLVDSGLRVMFYAFQGPARLSHYGLIYPDPLEGTRITLAYDDLKSDAQYTVRALVRGHTLGHRPDEETGHVEASVEVNARTIIDGIKVTGELAFVEVDVPRDLTKEGELRFSLVSHPDESVTGKERMMAGLCDFWLMERDKMPWNAPASSRLDPKAF